MDKALSHDHITRTVAQPELAQKAFWKLVKPMVRQVEWEDGCVVADDFLVEKPHYEPNPIITTNWDHSKQHYTLSINVLNSLYTVTSEDGPGQPPLLPSRPLPRPRLAQMPRRAKKRCAAQRPRTNCAGAAGCFVPAVPLCTVGHLVQRCRKHGVRCEKPEQALCRHRTIAHQNGAVTEKSLVCRHVWAGTTRKIENCPPDEPLRTEAQSLPQSPKSRLGGNSIPQMSYCQ